MTDAFDEAAGIGHNQDRTLIRGADLEAHLNATYEVNVARAKEILEKGQKFLTITDDRQDEDATEFMNSVRACWKTAEAARTDEKAPYDEAAGMVHSFFKTNILDALGLPPPDKKAFDPLQRPDLGLGPRISMAQTIYKVDKAEKERKARVAEAERQRKIEEDARKAAEEAQRLADEAVRAAARKRNQEAIDAANAAAAIAATAAAEARAIENRAAEQRAASEVAAAAPMADLSRARGARGGVSSLRTFPDYRDMDRDKLDLEALRQFIPDKAIDQAVKAWMDSNKATVATAIKNNTQPLKGVVIFEAYKSASRA